MNITTHFRHCINLQIVSCFYLSFFLFIHLHLINVCMYLLFTQILSSYLCIYLSTIYLSKVEAEEVGSMLDGFPEYSATEPTTTYHLPQYTERLNEQTDRLNEQTFRLNDQAFAHYLGGIEVNMFFFGG